MSQHAQDVAVATRAMGLGPSIIIGHSMGAFIATALAEQNPEFVAGLVLIDGGYMPATPAGVVSNEGLECFHWRRTTWPIARDPFPSRREYQEFWRTQPNFPAADWNRWVEAFLDYEVGGESPVQPKASEAASRADLGEAFQREAIIAR